METDEPVTRDPRTAHTGAKSAGLSRRGFLGGLGVLATASAAACAPSPPTATPTSAPPAPTGTPVPTAPAPEPMPSASPTIGSPTSPAPSPTSPSPQPSSTLTAPTVDATRLRTSRLLHRLGMGPKGTQFTTSLTLADDSLLDSLLTVPAQDAGVAATAAPLVPYIAPSAPFAERNAQVVAITSWWLQRMVAAEHGLTERMTWFWHGHWATSRTKVRETGLLLAQNHTLRQTALEDFGAQARALIVDPAMLLWLDGQRNTKASPNENLSREFLELFTLGAGNYTEDDVREAARALTGWRIAAPADGANSSTAYLDPKRHDATPASVLGVQIADATGLADLAVARPECPTFLAKRLWFRFVSSTEPLPESTGQRVVAALGERRNIAAGVRALVSDPTFTDPRYELVKSPVEWLVGAARALQVPMQTLAQNNVRSNLTAMGQIPFQPPSVGGWPAGRAWLTTTSAQRRLTLARLIAAAVDRSWLDGLPRAQRADAIADRLGIAWLSPNTREVISADAGGSERQLTLALISPEYVVSQ